MKTLRKLFLLSLLAISLVATGCAQVGDPETTYDEDGSVVVTTVTKKGKKTITETKTTKKDGTVIEKTKTEDEDGNATWEQTTTFADGSVGEQTGEETMNESGDIKSHSEETITYSDSNTSGKKTEKIVEDVDATDHTKGNVTTKTIEIVYKDGANEKTTEYKEPLTGVHTKETVKTNKDGSSVETKLDENTNYETGYTKETVIEKNSSGNPTKKVATIEYGNWMAKGTNPLKSRKTYSYSGGKETLVEEYTYDVDGDNNEIETTKKDGHTTIGTLSSYKDCYVKKFDGAEQEAEFFFKSDEFIVTVDFITGKVNYKFVNGAQIYFNTNWTYKLGGYCLKFDNDTNPTTINIGTDEFDLTPYTDIGTTIDESKLHVSIKSE